MVKLLHQIGLGGDTRDAERALKRVTRAVDGPIARFNRLAEAFGNVFQIGGAVIHGMERLGRAMQKPIQLAGAQEQAITRLNAALKLTGQFSEETVQGLQNTASALQKVSRFGDEAILPVEALLLQFGKISADQVPRATKAVIDFAEATGRDLKSAADLVSKAIGTSTNALSRYGIEIDNSLRGSERFEAIIGTIEETVGGTAEAMAGTFLGSLQQVSNAWGDLLETVGAFIVQNPAVQSVIKALTRLVEGWTLALQGNEEIQKRFQDAVTRFVKVGVPALLEGLASVVRAFGEVSQGFIQLAQDIENFRKSPLDFVLLRWATATQQLSAEIGLITPEQAFKNIERIKNDMEAAGLETDALTDTIGRLAERGAKRLEDLAQQARDLKFDFPEPESPELPGVSEGGPLGQPFPFAERVQEIRAILNAWAEATAEMAVRAEEFAEFVGEKASEIGASLGDSITNAIADRSEAWKEQFTEFGESIKVTLTEAIVEPILGAEGAFQMLFDAVVSPFAAIGRTLNDLIFKPLISGLLNFLGIKTAAEAAANATQVAQAAATAAAIGQTWAAVVGSMMPGLSTAASASLVATFGSSAVAAGLLPGILSTAAAQGAAYGATMQAAIPAFGEGGHVFEPTVAVVGDRPETIVPHGNVPRAHQLLSEMFASNPQLAPGGAGGGAVVVNSTVNAGAVVGDLDELADLIFERINDRLGEARL